MEQLHLALSHLPGMSLEQLEQSWHSASRHDAKFLLSQPELLRLLDAVPDDTAVLEIAGRRAFTYKTEYFDTEGREFYRHHVQKRLRRFKIRERIYVDSGQTQLEIKTREGTSRTQKFTLAKSHGLDAMGKEFIADFAKTTVRTTGISGDRMSNLISSAVTSFTRITLFTPTSAEKITVDFDLELSVGDKRIKAHPNIALVEVKSQIPVSHTVARLRQVGLRPTSFSKYSSAIDLLVSDRPRVHTRQTLARVFGTTSHE